MLWDLRVLEVNCLILYFLKYWSRLSVPETLVFTELRVSGTWKVTGIQTSLQRDPQ